MPSVAVTGASGYVGGLICRAFVENGWQVFGLSRRDPQLAQVDWLPWSLAGATLPPRATSIDCLVHAAYDFSLRDPRQSKAVNVGGSRTLLTSVPTDCREILVSSIAAKPGSRQDYALNKLATESITLARGGVVIRPGLVWGDASGGMMGKLSKLTRFPVIPVPAAQSRQYTTSARSLQEATVALAAATDWRSETRTVVDGPPVVFIRLLRQLAGPRHLLLPVPWRPVWTCLGLAETLGLRMPMSADSLYGLANSGVGDLSAGDKDLS